MRVSLIYFEMPDSVFPGLIEAHFAPHAQAQRTAGFWSRGTFP